MGQAFLAKHETVVEVVRLYEQAKADIEQGFALLANAEKTLNDRFDGVGRFIHIRNPHYGHGLDWTNPAGATEMLRRDVWSALVERLELRRFMSVKRFKDLEKAIDKGDVPEITVENVMSFGRALMVQLPDMMTEAVQEVFDFLRPPRSEYKTNTELELGERVILEYRVEPKWSGNGFHTSYHHRQELTCLENVFQMLDGRGMINKNHQSELQTAIEASEDGRGSTTYFDFKCFKKGTLHLKFRRMDLVQKFNQVAGGKRLKPEAA
jgi:hypothetical protein